MGCERERVIITFVLIGGVRERAIRKDGGVKCGDGGVYGWVAAGYSLGLPRNSERPHGCLLAEGPSASARLCRYPLTPHQLSHSPSTGNNIVTIRRQEEKTKHSRSRTHAVIERTSCTQTNKQKKTQK